MQDHIKTDLTSPDAGDSYDASPPASSRTQEPLTGHLVPGRRRWKRKTAFLFVTLIIGLAAFWSGYSKRNRDVRFWLTIPADSLSFGETWRQEALQMVLPIRNNLPHQVEVLRLSTTCGCVVSSLKTMSIPPGESRDVALTLDLTATPLAESAEQHHSFSAQLQAELSCPAYGADGTVAWNIQGTVLCPFTLSAQSVDFSDALIEGLPFPDATIRIRPRVALRSISAECDPAYATAALTECDGDGSQALLVRLSPRLARGEFSFPIQLRPETANGEAIPPQTLQVVGEVMPNVVASPRAIDFGLVNTGSTAAADLLLRSHNGANFRIERIENPHGIAVVSSNTSEAASHVVRVILQQTGLGTISETMVVAIRYANDTSDDIAIPLHAYVAARTSSQDAAPGTAEPEPRP